MTANTMTAAENIKVEDEIAAFCALVHHNPMVETSQDLLSIDHVVPEPSISDSSLKHPTIAVKKEKKRCKKHYIVLHIP